MRTRSIVAAVAALGITGAGLVAAAPVADAAQGPTTPIVVNTDTSYYRINAYADNNCSVDRVIVSPGYGTGLHSARSSYRVNAVSEIWVTGGAHKRVAKNVCYNFGSQDRYFVRSFKN